MDERQFSQRVRACEQKLYNTARMLLPCQADCEDAVQEALFKAWARLDSLRDTGRFEAWLMRILINECKMLLRRRRAHRESALTGAEEDFRVPDAPPGAEEMRAALRALEEKYRLPLLLHRFKRQGLHALVDRTKRGYRHAQRCSPLANQRRQLLRQ